MKKSLILVIVLTAFTFMLLAQQAEKPDMKGMCPDCQKQGMQMDKQMCKDGGMTADKHMCKEGMQPQNMQGMMEQMKLTPQQKKQLEALKITHEKYMNTKMADMQNLKLDHMNAMQAEDFVTAKKVNASISELQLSIDNANVDHMTELLKIFTPEQKEMFKAMHKQGMPMMQMKHDKKCKGKGMWKKHKKMQAKDSCSDCQK